MGGVNNPNAPWPGIITVSGLRLPRLIDKKEVGLGVLPPVKGKAWQTFLFDRVRKASYNEKWEKAGETEKRMPVSRKFSVIFIFILIMTVPFAFSDVKRAQANPHSGNIWKARKALEAIDSYRIRSEINGRQLNEQGGEETYYFLLDQKIVNKPARSVQTLFKLTQGKSKTSYETIQIGDKVWFKMGEGEWMLSKADKNSLPASLDDLPWDALVARRKGETQVNGIQCVCYAFNKDDILRMIRDSKKLGMIQRAEGEFCLAREGGFLVRYQLHLEGKNLINAAMDGVMNIRYDVLDFHKKFDIHSPTPENSGEIIGGMALKNIPKPKGAKISATMPHMLILSAPGKVTAVANFYRDAMRVKGWSLGEDNAMGGLITLSFRKKDNHVTVNITPGEGGHLDIMISDSSQ